MDYLTSTEIRTGLKAIADDPLNAPFCTLGTLAATGAGTPWTFLEIKKTTAPSPKKFLVTAGVHGNEWVPPEAVLNFTKNLLDAFHAGTGVKAGAITTSVAEVKAILDKIHIFVAPIVNPDGYDHSLTTLTPNPVPFHHLTGRKNRTIAAPACAVGAGSHDGVNINRNCDIVWDHLVKYGPGRMPGTSDDTFHVNFRGSALLSEAEATNVRTLLDKGIQFFIDCHMAGRLVLYPWGIETPQDAAKGHAIIPTMNFHNPDHDVGGVGPVRDGVPGNAYREHIDQADLKRARRIAWGMQDAILRGTGVVYTPQPGSKLAAVTGAVDDFAFSRHLAPGAPVGTEKVFAFTLESGSLTAARIFQPSHTAASGFPAIQKEVHCAVLHFLVHVAGLP